MKKKVWLFYFIFTFWFEMKLKIMNNLWQIELYRNVNRENDDDDDEFGENWRALIFRWNDRFKFSKVVRGTHILITQT